MPEAPQRRFKKASERTVKGTKKAAPIVKRTTTTKRTASKRTADAAQSSRVDKRLYPSGYTPPSDWNSNDELSQTFVGNRVRTAAGKVTLDKFFTFIPVRCSWCRQVRKPDELMIHSHNFNIMCSDRQRCEASYKEANKRSKSSDIESKPTTRRKTGGKK